MDHSKRIKFMAFILGWVSIVSALLYWNSGRYIARGVYLGNQFVEGMTREQVTPVAEQMAERLGSLSIHLEGDGLNVALTPQELGVSFDVSATVDKLFKVGRSLWLKAEVLSSNSQPTFSQKINLVLTTEKNQLEQAVQKKLTAYERPVQNAELVFSATDGWSVIPALFGQKIAEGEAERITEEISQELSAPDDSNANDYFVRTERLEPTVKEFDLPAMLATVKELSQTPVQVQFGKIKETLDIALNPAPWFVFDYVDKTVHVNPDQIAFYAANFADRYDVEPSEVKVKGIQEAISEYNGEPYQKAVIEGEFRSGRTIDQDQLISDLTKLLLQSQTREIRVKSKTLPVKVVSQVSGYTFPELVSVGQSSFHLGNHDNRIHNIKRALELQNLTVIAPGEVFSYNRVLGWVTLEKGYVNAQVIFGDVAVNAPGGGVCQTSTTMFRAAVNAGLSILERSNHSWDVAYYRDWYGVDAAVYPPGNLDLKFLNDTPGPLLVHAYTDDENEMAYFELYGTSDGRQVRTETVENIRVGVGRRVVTNWDVTRPDGVVEKREIVSRYRR
ncbi:MAG: VanW family protein [Candidatus Peregrinibacteria bacterium]